MDEGARRWLIKQARQNLWRVWHWYDLDDLIQDGALQYARVVAKYPHVTEPKHRMALFQVTWISFINTISKARTRELSATAELTDMLAHCDLVPEEATFAVLCNQAPVPVVAALKLLQSEVGRKALRARYRKKRDGHRETTNERWCRLTGFDPATIDLPGMIRSHFEEVAT